ncbi:pantothenate kinase [Malassezia pachydermatis]
MNGRSSTSSSARGKPTLNPVGLTSKNANMSFDPRNLRRRSLPPQFPGGRLNFTKFETGHMDQCVVFLRELIERSAAANHVSVEDMQKSVKIMATGGGAHLFYERFSKELGVEVERADEMECLISGLNFMTLIPDEVFWFSDELIDDMTNGPLPEKRGDSSVLSAENTSLPRPSPCPPLYAPLFESDPSPKLPCLLVNIGSGVSILKVDEHGQFERVSGTSLGGGTLWGLLGLLTDAQNFDEMLELCERGDNSNVDMLVGDIYGPVGLDHLGLKASTIASSFGKVFRWDRRSETPPDENRPQSASERRRGRFRQEDICRSLLYAISNNIGQIAHMNAEKYKLDRIYFSGCFIRGHRATIATLSYAIRFWSNGRRRAYFLRHEGYLGAIGAWVRHVAAGGSSDEDVDAKQTHSAPAEPSMNPILAEALGGLPLDALPSVASKSASTESDDSPSEALTPHTETMTSHVADLLEELADLDHDELPHDPNSIAKLMQQLDQAHQVAETIEARVDSLLSKLNDLMPTS